MHEGWITWLWSQSWKETRKGGRIEPRQSSSQTCDLIASQLLTGNTIISVILKTRKQGPFSPHLSPGIWLRIPLCAPRPLSWPRHHVAFLLPMYFSVSFFLGEETEALRREGTCQKTINNIKRPLWDWAQLFLFQSLHFSLCWITSSKCDQCISPQMCIPMSTKAKWPEKRQRIFICRSIALFLFGCFTFVLKHDYEDTQWL